MLSAVKDIPAELRPLQNVEGELALLGALMIDNRLVDQVADKIGPEDFFEPVAGRIYSAILGEVSSGRAANPVILRPFFENDAGMEKLGGPGFLAALTGSGVGLIAARQFAEQIAELAKRRRLYDALGEIQANWLSALEKPIEVLGAEIDEAVSTALIRTSTTRSLSLVTAFDQSLKRIDDEAAGIAVPGIQLAGFNDWNKLTGNMRRGETIILGGRPGMGKTATALRAALCASAGGYGTLFISLEMVIDELVRRAIADVVFQYGQNPTYEQIREARLNPFDRRKVQDARDRIAEWPLELTDPSSLKIGQLAMMVRRYQRKMQARGKTLDVVFIDYLGLVKPDKESGNRTQDIGLISRTIKSVAKECGVAIVLLAQLNRKVEEREDKRPQLQDLRDAGDIEQDADTVLFVYREEYYLRKSEPPESDKRHAAWQVSLDAARDRLELIAAKRRGGREGRRNCHFFGAHQAVRDSTFFSDRSFDDAPL